MWAGCLQEGDKSTKVSKLKKGEFLMINIGSTSVGARVAGVRTELARLELTGPVCTRVRSFFKSWDLLPPALCAVQPSGVLFEEVLVLVFFRLETKLP